MTKQKLKRGLAAADEETRRRVTSLGGKAVSKNRAHMSKIGRKGGIKSRPPKSTK